MQEVIGSTPIFSTSTLNAPDIQQVNEISGAYSATSQPNNLPLSAMTLPEIPYTTPKIVKGKQLKTDVKGVQRARMEAEQNWYVEFLFHNPKTGKMERFRPTKGLNRIKDPKEKLAAFTDLCFAYKTALEGGWNPLDEQECTLWR